MNTSTLPLTLTLLALSGCPGSLEDPDRFVGRGGPSDASAPSCTSSGAAFFVVTPRTAARPSAAQRMASSRLDLPAWFSPATRHTPASGRSRPRARP